MRKELGMLRSGMETYEENLAILQIYSTVRVGRKMRDLLWRIKSGMKINEENILRHCHRSILYSSCV